MSDWGCLFYSIPEPRIYLAHEWNRAGNISTNWGHVCVSEMMCTCDNKGNLWSFSVGSRTMRPCAFYIMPSAPIPPPFTLQVFLDFHAIFLEPVVIWSSSLRELMTDQVVYLPPKKERKKEDWEIEVEIAEQMGDVTVILPSFAVLKPIQIAQILAFPSHSAVLGAPWIWLPDLACTRIESARPQKNCFHAYVRVAVVQSFVSLFSMQRGAFTNHFFTTQRTAWIENIKLSWIRKNPFWHLNIDF